MKGEFFRPCPKCGRLCNSELDICEICSGKIAKPEPVKPISPVASVVTPVVEPIVEEVAPVVEERVATEEVIEKVATEENIVEEITNEEKQEEVVAPVIETKAPKGKGAKVLYTLVAVLMLVIVALVVVIVQDKQPAVAVDNTIMSSNTTSTTLKQETETTTEIITGTTAQNAGETLVPVSTTKKVSNSNKETTTKKNTSSATKETTTKKLTTTTTETNKVEFNPEIVYSKDKVYRDGYYSFDCGIQYYCDFKIKKVYFENSDFNLVDLCVEVEILKLYEEIYNEDSSRLQIVEVESFDKLGIKERIYCPDLYAICYTENSEYWKKDQVACYHTDYYKGSFKKGAKITLQQVGLFEEDDIKNVTKIVIDNE